MPMLSLVLHIDPLTTSCVNNVITGRTCIKKRKISGSSYMVEQKCVNTVKRYMQMPMWDTGSLATVSRQSSVYSLWVLESQSGCSGLNGSLAKIVRVCLVEERRRKALKIRHREEEVMGQMAVSVFVSFRLSWSFSHYRRFDHFREK